MSAPGADAAQPGTAPDGQGQGQDPSSEYTSVFGEDAFSDAPEELRPHLQRYVQTQVDPKLTQRFQESAQFKQTWEPYSQIEGLTNLAPEAVDELVEFGYTVDAASDENHPQRQQAIDQLRETWEGLGEQFGFFEGDDGEGDDGEDEGEEPDRIAQLEAKIQELEQGRQQDTMQQSTQQHQAEIQSFVDKLDLPGDPGSDEREEAVTDLYTFMQRYAEDPDITNEQMVKAAFEDYQRLTGGAQRRLLEENGDNVGGRTVNGGGADTAPPEVKSFADADRLARARMGAGR